MCIVKFVALFRGINVGKSVQVSMKTLKSILEELGFKDVITYLNSGNVVFDSDRGASELAQLITDELEKKFGQNIPVLVKSSAEIIDIQESIPDHWRSDKTEQTYVAYLFSDVARPEIIDELPIKKQYMEIKYAHEAIIWNIKRENYNRSQITKIASHVSYGRMTTRNVNTARKLAEMCKGK
jgi:uncharacterized protein (DUF1697 family)